MRPTRGSSRLIVSLLTLLAIVVVCGQNAAADVDEFDWSRKSQSLPCDLADALQWQPHLPAAALRRAVSYKGDMLRLDMFLYKLVVQRLPVTVAVVGGPVTFLSAGHRGPQPVLFNQGLYETTGERSHSSAAGWLASPLLSSRLARLCFQHTCPCLPSPPLTPQQQVGSPLLLTLSSTPTLPTTHSPPQGWLSLALDNLIRAFPPRHLKQWRAPGQSKSAVVAEPYWLINLGLPRGSLATWASCDGATFLQSLPDDVDLVIAELALSDQGEAKGQGAGSFLQMYDSVLQQLLLRWGGGAPQNPPQTRQWQKGREGGLEGVKAAAGAAVVMVNFFSFCRGNRACRQQEDPSLSFADVGPFSFGLPPHHPAYPHRAPEVVSEDNITVLAQYYSLPVLSTRDAFFTLLGHQVSTQWSLLYSTCFLRILQKHLHPPGSPGTGLSVERRGHHRPLQPSTARYRLKDVVTTGPSSLPLHVEPDTLASAIPPAAAVADGAGDFDGTLPVDSIDSIDPHALSGVLPTALQAKTKYADVITALFHSALKGKSACSQHLSIMAFESDLKVNARPERLKKATLLSLSWGCSSDGLIDRLTKIHPAAPSCPPCCALLPSLLRPPALPAAPSCPPCCALLPSLLRPPPPFVSCWIHSTAASGFHPLSH
ncbi:unnamed protein product [Closterium sp. Naga37s-1]|nr:unnamed protein product [Closterium sp. Naga37s-1]